PMSAPLLRNELQILQSNPARLPPCAVTVRSSSDSPTNLSTAGESAFKARRNPAARRRTGQRQEHLLDSQAATRRELDYGSARSVEQQGLNGLPLRIIDRQNCIEGGYAQ